MLDKQQCTAGVEFDHEPALVEFVGLALQVLILLIRGVQPCGMLLDRSEPSCDAFVLATGWKGLG
ncbi:hypothetical protein CJT63_25835 [Pseudomonas aeruginosa]|nr:hypothetical protein CJT63_25835 [Pseudomonas aeruginosa]RPO21781.1 hypothetical protein IPC1223_08895 [Pseudomonas aeruginosa]